MPNIVLIMQRKVIAEGLMIKLRDSPDISLVYEPDYHEAITIIRNYGAKAALIEATESGLYDMEYCLYLCKRLRSEIPECKLLLMCSEQDEKSVRKVVEAKGKKEIDDFVFYDVTIDYLASKLTSL
ncbi:MAG: hypothetical protein RBR71_07970 [Gudongella sp.]|nr:hypothetical protein [Gudongella sp.]